mmetsp:Transcript_34741/g.63157  ORF Transcript_34741/g.63157 Transcript_34741/m.63157 type:complete len:350 (+) Transcript_34741:48-1097(+)
MGFMRDIQGCCSLRRALGLSACCAAALNWVLPGAVLSQGDVERVEILDDLNGTCPADNRHLGMLACDGTFPSSSRRSSGMVGSEQVRDLSDEVSATGCSFVRDPSWQLEVWPPPEPAILTNATAGWSARASWRSADFLRQFGEWRLPLNTFLRDPWLSFVSRHGKLVQRPVDVSFEEYLEVRSSTRKNVFLFLRDDLQSKEEELRGRKGLRRRFFEALKDAYAAPRGVDDDLGLRIFAMDGLASGHGMHRHKEAWLASFAGRKVWWVAPPKENELDNMDGRPVFPYKALSNEEGGWPCAWLLQEDLVPTGAPVQRCVQQPGEVVLLPPGWWHMTCSLDDFNVAVGGQGV